ncbi:DUF4224 domain-containing protein [Alicycliphilus denitrificans]|uniref:DUF4224 domain-containing protein n=1 Tax=Alicycliphilus denitrificans TaxID=179636 RepID=UPI0001DA022F|nr:DUF4224 domain-containing protein [Alicycliphilus denitrificans]ADU98994.1 hypothetical protein Alide_1233 [Alicycliphilus denitrificans BC]
MIHLPPYLTDAEIAGMCEPLIQPAAQCRRLKAMGLHFVQKPNGRPLVMRTELDRVLGAGRFAGGQDAKVTAPNAAALLQHLGRKGIHGARA